MNGIILNSVLWLLMALPGPGRFSATLTKQQSAFVDSLLVPVKAINAEILQQREGIMLLYRDYRSGEVLTAAQLNLLRGYFSYYGVEGRDSVLNPVVTKSQFEQLLSRVDVVPEDYAIVRAILLSGWGTNALAHGYGFFGLACSKPLLDPVRLAACHRTYSGLRDAVRDYALLLNTSGAFAHFRDLRAAARINGEPAPTASLVKSLFPLRKKLYHQVRELLPVVHRYIENKALTN